MKKYYFLFIALNFFGTVLAQNPSDFDPSFNLFNLPLNQYHVDATVKKSVVLPDGKIVLIKGKEIVRLQGNLADTSFNTGTGFINTSGSCFLTTFAVQPDGKIIVGGYFDKYNGVSKLRLLRLNQDGSLDTSFTLQGFNLENGGASQIEVLPDGKILLQAEQTSSGGIFNNLKRLLPNGAVDNSFVTVPNYGFGAFAVQPDGKVVVTHNTNNDFYSQRDKVARLNPNGSFDATFTMAECYINVGGYVSINKLLVLSSGKILVGGTFSGCNSQSAWDLIQLNANGSVDTSFNIGSGFAAENTSTRLDNVSDIVAQSDGKIIVGGRFSEFNWANKMNLLRLHPNGSLDTSYADTNTFVNIGIISSVDLFSDEKILVSGSLGENKAGDRFITKINTDGTKDTSFNNTCKGFYGGVNKLVTLPDGKILAGGSFYTYNDAKKVSFLRLNNDGSVDPSLTYGGGGGFLASPSEGGIFAISTTAAGKIYLGGTFTTFNGQPVSDLVRLNNDGTRDTGFDAGTGIDYGLYTKGRIKDILALPNGDVLVAGNFSKYDENNCTGLLRLSSPGYGAYGGGFSGIGNDVTCLKLLSDGYLLVGLSHLGSSTGNMNTSQGAIKKYNTTTWALDPSFILDSSLSQGSVTSMEVQQDGKILLCGQFSHGGGTRSLVRILSNGSIDPTFNYSIQNSAFMIEEIALLPNQKIVVSYVDALYTYYSKVIRLNSNGTIDTTFDQKILKTDGSNIFLKSQADGKIYAYGILFNSQGNPGSGLNRLLGEDYNFVQGQNRLDSNNNGCDVSDSAFTNLKLHVSSGANNFDYIANTTGNYNAAITVGSHTITPVLENPTYFNVSPSVVNVTFPTQTSPFTQNFCITNNGVHPDLEVTLLPLIPARPGFDAKYKIIYKNKGNTTQSGSVNLAFNDGVLDFILANPVTSTQTVNNLSWAFTNLLPFETREIALTLNVNSPMESPAVNGGDILNYTTSITSAATDDMPNDNTLVFNQIAVNSFDPNDKTCLEGSTISPAKVGEYVHYMIRFENTGTFPAENIVVKDMIDTAKFDINTLVPLKGSHSFVTNITSGNKVEFIFENINLPFDDANNDGYVAFKIKTKPTLVLGNTFSNTASIYFDYNFPIVTNTATTTIAVLANQDFVFSNYFTVYPNPVKDILNITAKEAIELTSINIYNTLGQLVLVIPNAQNTKTVDVSGLTKGNYFIKINSDKGTANTKFIKN